MTSATFLEPWPEEAARVWRPGAVRSALATGHMGPNVLLQTSAVLHDRLPREQAERIVRAGTGWAPSRLPTQLVDESTARALVRACLDELGVRTTRAVLREAGQRTAGYLLARRIPKPVQALLHLTPSPLAYRILGRAMASSAWTFAGTGQFTVRTDAWGFRIEGCAMCRHLVSEVPLCDFYAGTFERLLSALVKRDLSVAEVSCEAMGAPACEFEVRGR